MNHPDTSWCPVCSRQILPKRYLVPVPNSAFPPTAPAPPPSSPSASPSKLGPSDPPVLRQTRHKTGTIRPKGGGGLVRGTGRVKPNGALKRSDSKRDATAPPSLTVSEVPAAPVKHRTVIDQNPTPLYCSDECRLADLNSLYGGLSIDYNPARDSRESPPLPPVPHNSLTGVSPVTTESDSASSPSSSPDSQGSNLATEENPFHESPVMTPSVAALARIYGFPPLPPRPAILDEQDPPSRAFDNDYQSGVMMAARRIKETLCPEPPSRRTVRPFSQPPSRERKPIPGWTDGTDAWRASVYSLSSPSQNVTRTETTRNGRPTAYGSFAASPHRSAGVYSTLGDKATPTVMHDEPMTPSSVRSPPPLARANTSEDLYSKYPLSFSRRSESRMSLSGSSPHSFPAPVRRREQILKPGAEGKLLVPDVKLRSSSAVSSYCNDGASVSSWRSSSTRSLAHSPLSRQSSDASVESDLVDDPLYHKSTSSATRRSSVETRSWSYENMTTYPAMPMPPRKEIRFEKRLVNGVVTVVETEVEVQPQLKRLFLFPGKDSKR